MIGIANFCGKLEKVTYGQIVIECRNTCPLLAPEPPLLEPILLDYAKFYEFPPIPLRVAPFGCAGLGAFPLPVAPQQPNLLHFEPTLPTMTLEAHRDLITGDVIDYVDLPTAPLRVWMAMFGAAVRFRSTQTGDRPIRPAPI
jgi:hypothetical protein